MKQLIKIIAIIVAVTISYSYTANAQVSINNDGTDPDASAMLEVKSSTKGFLPPRMTTVERDAISSPAEGLVIYNTDKKRLDLFNGTLWINATGYFNCGDQIVDSEDNIYNTILIGTQCWMAENLNIGTRIDGSNEQTDNSTIEKYCYGDNASNCDTYGGLYQWDEMMQYVSTEGTQGVCPTGWHLPSDDEIKTLELQLGMTQAQADATGYRGSDQGSQLAGNEPLWTNGALDQNSAFGTSGFAALPGGRRNTNGSFSNQSSTAVFWSSSESGSAAWRRYLFNLSAQVGRSYGDEAYGSSVRCVRD